MKKRTKHLMGALALVAGTVGALGAILMKKGKDLKRSMQDEGETRDVWARPGMSVTFRAEVMPGRDRSERTFRVTQLLKSGRVLLDGVIGEHTETEFEPIR